jgi:hypothetical protein
MIIAGIYSCSSQYPILSQKVATEASQLKEFCKQEELKSETVTKADSLYFISDDLIKKGNHEKSYYLMELAVIYYRLSLCAHDFIVSENTIDTLKNTLSDTQEELKTYQRILTELESKEL